MQAFILSAGKGTRLLPYTKILPKPLFPILGKPIIEIILDQLKKLGITSIGINVFHLKEKLLNFLKSYQNKNPQLEIQIFEEQELLGTGGAILNAKNFFKERTLIINSDILTNFDFKKFYFFSTYLSSPVIMVLYKGEKNNVCVDFDSNIILSFRKYKKNLFTFAGIQIIDPYIIKYFPFKKDLIEIYQELIKRKINISAYIENNSYFKDIGTIKNYLKAHEDILINKIKIPEVPFYSNSLVIKSKNIDKNVVLKDWVYIEEDTIIENNTQLSRVISWKGAYIKSGIYENKILI
ncbi:MAG: NDP-sugar pyrophosphorylase [Thermodesulfobacteria bacterium]|nr:NDP-sugar synthase [Thermodesulfobacteriota bacterium]MCU4139079.1 NDP-sugar pyrophosphorylase [Thermodesulfobacteriota bacterium]